MSCDIDHILIRVRIRHHGRKLVSDATCLRLGDTTLIPPAARPRGEAPSLHVIMQLTYPP